MATTKEQTSDDAKFAQEIARLAEAIRDLAHRPERPESDEDPEQRRLSTSTSCGRPDSSTSATGPWAR